MDDNKDKKTKKSEWELIDLLIPILATALGIYYLSTLKELPAIGKYYGTALSILIFVCSAIVLVIAIKNKLWTRTEELKDTFTKKNANGANRVVVIAILAAISLAYVFGMKYVGFVVATIIYMIAVMYFLGRRGLWRLIVPALLVTLIGFILFAIVLNLKMPLDPVTQSLKYTLRRLLF